MSTRNEVFKRYSDTFDRIFESPACVKRTHALDLMKACMDLSLNDSQGDKDRDHLTFISQTLDHIDRLFPPSVQGKLSLTCLTLESKHRIFEDIVQHLRNHNVSVSRAFLWSAVKTAFRKEESRQVSKRG